MLVTPFSAEWEELGDAHVLDGSLSGPRLSEMAQSGASPPGCGNVVLTPSFCPLRHMPG